MNLDAPGDPEADYIFFPAAPKKYKQVKTVSMQTARKNGETRNSVLMVYMDTSGTPSFCMPVPDAYAQVWNTHCANKEWDRGFGSVKAESGKPFMLHAPTFEKAVEFMEKIIFGFSHHMKSMKIEKVICLSCSVVIEGGITYNAPSFHASDFLVGITGNIAYSVNGKLYNSDSSYDKEDDLIPDIRDLHPTDRMRGKVIPYSPEAWATVQGIKETLSRAGKMLHDLVKSEETELLLKNGLMGLLAAPTTTKE